LWLGLGDLGPIHLRLEGLESFSWSGLSLVYIAMVAFELVFAGEAIVSAVLASERRTWESGCIGAMSDEVVALEISPLLGGGFASFFQAVVVSNLAEMCPLVVGSVTSARQTDLLTSRISAWNSVNGPASAFERT